LKVKYYKIIDITKSSIIGTNFDSLNNILCYKIIYLTCGSKSKNNPAEIIVIAIKNKWQAIARKLCLPFKDY